MEKELNNNVKKEDMVIEKGTYRAEQRRCRRSYGYFRGLSILLSTRKYLTFDP